MTGLLAAQRRRRRRPPCGFAAARRTAPHPLGTTSGGPPRAPCLPDRRADGRARARPPHHRPSPTRGGDPRRARRRRGTGAPALPRGQPVARYRLSRDNRVELAALVVAIVLVVILVRRGTAPLGVPTPIALLVAGAVLSFVPAVPDVPLSSEPVLYGLCRCSTRPPCRPRCSTCARTGRRSSASRSAWCCSPPWGSGSSPGSCRRSVRARGGARRDRRPAGCRGGHRGGAPDRPAAQDHDDPRGRVAAQRRDGPGVAAHRQAAGLTAHGGCRPRRWRTRHRR